MAIARQQGDNVDWGRMARIAFVALFALLAWRDLQLLLMVYGGGQIGLDYLPIWAAGRSDPSRIYDFSYITARQGWPEGAHLRPFVYPPSALLFLAPFSALPYDAAFPLFTACSVAVFLWGGRRLGASWLMLIPSPLLLAVLAGQVALLLGGLVMIAVTLKRRPLLAGLLFAVVGAIKPQMLLLLPLALAAERNWRTFAATGLAACALLAASLFTGAGWLAWMQALPRFAALVAATPGLASLNMAPAALWGPWVLLLTAPLAALGVWLAFRSGEPAAQVLALLAGAVSVSPYAMDYELAALGAAILALGGSTVWSLPFWAGVAIAPGAPLTFLTAFLPLLARLWPGRATETGMVAEPPPCAEDLGSDGSHAQEVPVDARLRRHRRAER